ncbi:MAG TPA: methyltransferase domain-containing protein [Flavipsychrobacter sp.]|nr:methyltransferase domain-containing protein [Flavipsychrobacter sp.]
MPGVKSVLFLGSGIGSGAQILNEMGFYPEIALVDNDVEVLRLAKKLLPPQKLRFECVDANEFIEISTENFDLIVIDLFLGRVTVPYVSTAGFIEKCRQRLLVGGIIVVNFMVNSKEDQKQFEFLSKNLLPASEVIDLGINKVIVTTT